MPENPIKKTFARNAAVAFAIGLALCLLCGWTKPENHQLSPEEVQEVTASSLVEEMQNWGKHVTQMKEAGQLPGIASDDHGTIRMGDTYGRRELHEIQYPLDFMGIVQREREPDALYNYLFRKENAGSNWKLIRAWKTDCDGKYLAPLPIEPVPEKE